jgi:hypothetical protein
MSTTNNVGKADFMINWETPCAPVPGVRSPRVRKESRAEGPTPTRSTRNKIQERRYKRAHVCKGKHKASGVRGRRRGPDPAQETHRGDRRERKLAEGPIPYRYPSMRQAGVRKREPEDQSPIPSETLTKAAGGIQKRSVQSSPNQSQMGQ